MENSRACIVFITCSSTSEAENLARVLVEERLAACCSIISNVASMYRWEGRIQHDEESLILCKTVSERIPALEERVHSLHSYDVPEILAVPVSHGSESYLAWLERSIRDESD